MNTKNCFKQMMALLAMLFAGLCVTPRAWAQYAGAGEGRVYIRIFTFAEIVNPVVDPVLVDKANAGDVVDRALSRYNISGNSGTLLYRAVQTGLSALKEDSAGFPDDVTSINLLTFTDGLDQGSTIPSLPPIGRERISFAMKTSDESRQILRGQFDDLQRDGIALRSGNRIPVNVYSIGLMGDDVADERAFQQSLQDIATSPAMGIKADNLQMVKMEFDRIAQTLSTKTSMIELSIPGPAPGTKVRWTFDVPSAKKTNNTRYNLPEAALGSRYYIEGDFDYDVNGTPLMRNIAYSGVSSRDPAGSTIRGGPNRNNPAMVDFVFYEYKLESDSKDDAQDVREWIMEPGRNWQANVETDMGIQDTVRQSTAVIYIVLDQSKSMSSQGISQVKEAVKDFINVFVPIKESTSAPRTPVTVSVPSPSSAPSPAPKPSSNPHHYFSLNSFVTVVNDLVGAGFGLGYEGALGDWFSMGYYAGVVTVGNSNTDLAGTEIFAGDFLIKPRLYPFGSAVRWLFLGAALGYRIGQEVTKEEVYHNSDYSWGYGYNTIETHYNDISGFIIGVEAGVKFAFSGLGAGLELVAGYTFGDYGGFKFGTTFGITW
ncbi:MAG: hypothetical protein LBL06_00510 [Treponema sp.]|nr:hypothetical protein [Treponema sp.]